MDQAVFSYKLMLLPLLACSKYLKWQISNICNISRKRWGINMIFWVKLNIKVFYKLILGMMHIWHTGKLSKFQYPLPLVHIRQKIFHRCDLGRPIIKETPTLFSKLWSSTVHVNERNQNKRKKSRHIQIDHAFCRLI